MVTIREHIQIVLEKDVDNIENNHYIQGRISYELDSCLMSRSLRFEKYKKFNNET